MIQQQISNEQGSWNIYLNGSIHIFFKNGYIYINNKKCDECDKDDLDSYSNDWTQVININNTVIKLNSAHNLLSINNHFYKVDS